jgi:hypothetical protein
MEAFMPILLLILLVVVTTAFGVDSRPADTERPTRWFPAPPRD